MIPTGLIGGFGLLVLAVAVLALVLYLVPVPLWIAAWASGAYVGLFTLIAMRLRRVPPPRSRWVRDVESSGVRKMRPTAP